MDRRSYFLSGQIHRHLEARSGGVQGVLDAPWSVLNPLTSSSSRCEAPVLPGRCGPTTPAFCRFAGGLRLRQIMFWRPPGGAGLTKSSLQASSLAYSPSEPLSRSPSWTPQSIQIQQVSKEAKLTTSEVQDCKDRKDYILYSEAYTRFEAQGLGGLIDKVQ